MALFVFITCTCLGVLSGIIYDVLYIARSAVCGINRQAYTVKDKIFTAICDILYCIIFAVAFVFISVMFDFDSLRLYMLIACILGAFLYLKSFHIIVAFLVRKVYNTINYKKEIN